MAYTVYKHTAPNGKVYIGMTCKKPEHRWQKGNGYKGSEKFSRAIEKYGWDNIKHEILASGLTREEAASMEIELIAAYDSTNEEHGYNISTGGSYRFAGYHITKEQKRKIGDAQRGPLNHMYGKRWKMSEEGRQHIRESRTGMKFSEEHCKNISRSKSKENHPNWGKHLPEETRRKIALSNSKPVICVDTGERFESVKEAVRITGITHVGDVCRGKEKTAGGLRWKWADDDNQDQRSS